MFEDVKRTMMSQQLEATRYSARNLGSGTSTTCTPSSPAVAPPPSANTRPPTITVNRANPIEGWEYTEEGRESRHTYRVRRIDFPRILGVDVAIWLYQYKRNFEVDGTRDESKLNIVAIHLEGKALQWYQGYMKIQSQKKGITNLTWPEYIDV